MNTHSSTIRILHVDDDPEFADMTAAFLEREDGRFDVETATGASEGLDRVADGRIDCIVSDYEMPGRDGIEFLEAVREGNPDLPFILFTGKGSEEVASTAISAGVTDYLQKESTTSQYAVLANRIRNVVEGLTARRERQRHLDAIETAQEGISILENDRFIYVNEAYADLYGYEPEELIGEHWEVIYPDEDVEEVHEEILPTLEATGRWHGQTTGLRADGSTFTEDHTLAMTDGDRIVCTVRDVTERERQQKRLERANTRLELAVEGANLGVWDWDMRTDEVQFNDRWAEMLGYTPEEIEPHLDAWETRVHPDDIDDVEAALQSHADGETAYYDTEHRMRTADGDWKWIRDTGKIVERSDAGEPIRAVGIHLDVTEQKRREQELESKKRRLEEFASVVSHDLRNPLNVAAARVDLARRECDSEHLDATEAALDRMGELLGDLLQLARSGRHIDETVPVDLGSLVESCWRNVETGDATLVAGGERSIRADRTRVSQLFENLFRNAVEHGSTGNRPEADDSVEHGSTGSRAGPDDDVERGRADVTVTVGELDDGFYVADDGPGIPEEDREDVFEVGHSSSAEGTGFGLSIARRIAQAHGWEIRVTEGDSGGARFEVTGVEFVTE